MNLSTHCRSYHYAYWNRGKKEKCIPYTNMEFEVEKATAAHLEQLSTLLQINLCTKTCDNQEVRNMILDFVCPNVTNTLIPNHVHFELVPLFKQLKQTKKGGKRRKRKAKSKRKRTSNKRKPSKRRKKKQKTS